MSAFFSILAAQTSNAHAQPSTKAARTIVQPLTCDGCGAPLQWSGAACSYCRRGVVHDAYLRPHQRQATSPAYPLDVLYGFAPKRHRYVGALTTDDWEKQLCMPGGITYHAGRSPSDPAVSEFARAEVQQRVAIDQYFGGQGATFAPSDASSATPSGDASSFDMGTGGDW